MGSGSHEIVVIQTSFAQNDPQIDLRSEGDALDSQFYQTNLLQQLESSTNLVNLGFFETLDDGSGRLEASSLCKTSWTSLGSSN
jgi:hypothetical protein